MTREQFLRKLTTYIKSLPETEQEDLLIYYRDLFDGQGIEDFDEVPDCFSSPQEIALEVLSDADLKSELPSNPESERKPKFTACGLYYWLFLPCQSESFTLLILILAVFFLLAITMIAPIRILISGSSSLNLANGLLLSGLFLTGLALLLLLIHYLPHFFRPIARRISQQIIKHKELTDEE